MDIPRQSLWEYVGDQTKWQNSLHMVISREPDEVVTWSKNPNITWLGSEMDFLKNFKPAVSGKPFSFI